MFSQSLCVSGCRLMAILFFKKKTLNVPHNKVCKKLFVWMKKPERENISFVSQNVFPFNNLLTQIKKK